MYRHIETSFWNDSKISDSFTPEDKLFYLYAMTTPRGNLCGCFEASPRQMGADLGYRAESVVHLLDRFEHMHGVLMYDDETHEVLLLNWYKYQWGKSPKLRTAIEKEMRSIKSDKFREMIRERIEKFYDDEEIATKPEHKATKKQQPKHQDAEAEFEQWWAEYPKPEAAPGRKRDKVKCKALYSKIISDGVAHADMMAALRACKATRDWTKDGGAYVQMPATYLRQRTFEAFMGQDAPATGLTKIIRS